MNHEELENLINRSNNLLTKLNTKINQLQGLRNIREASRNTGNRPKPEYSAYHTSYEAESPNRYKAQDNKGATKRKVKIRDQVKVIRGRNQGVTTTIIRETPAQYELRSEQVTHTFMRVCVCSCLIPFWERP